MAEVVAGRAVPDAMAARFFEHAPDLLAVVQLEGQILHVNEAWTLRLGHPREALVGGQVLDFIHQDDRLRFVDEAQQLLTGNPVIGFAARCRAVDGTYRALQWSASVDPRDPLLAFVVARDLSAEVELAGLIDRVAGEGVYVSRAEASVIIAEARGLLARSRLRVRRAA